MFFEDGNAAAACIVSCLVAVCVSFVLCLGAGGAAGGYGARMLGASPQVAMAVGVSSFVCLCALCYFGPWNNEPKTT